ncbi:MAG: LacI family transcription regulator [Chloroflexi bacterium]|nr:LacI family transcription regulator [Chloroflexota bacterium]
MAVTIKDIAKQTGVSHSTVSRALRGSNLVSAQTTQHIQRVAVEMGYHPSAAARSLKTNQTHALGVVVSSIDDPFFGEILQGIEDVAQSNGYSLFIAASQRDSDRERLILQAMSEHRVDGVIICSTSFSNRQSRLLQEYGIPIVVINNQAAEDYRYSIYHDDIDGSRQITRYLIGLGHQKIAYLGNSLSGRTTQDRMSGYQQEMQASRLLVPPGYIHEVPGGGPTHGMIGLDHFLDLPDRPTALVCFNDLMAIGVLKGLQLAGIEVPEELSVTGFDNILFSAYTNPPLTTFDQPKKYIGSEAARLLLGLFKSDTGSNLPDSKIQILKGRLLVRKSTAPPAEM